MRFFTKQTSDAGSDASIAVIPDLLEEVFKASEATMAWGNTVAFLTHRMESPENIMDILTLAGIILTFGLISLGLLLYFRQRTKQRLAAAINQEQPNSDETVTAEDRAYAENFYCIMLTDGTCRPGIMMDPPKQAPGVRTLDGDSSET